MFVVIVRGTAAAFYLRSVFTMTHIYIDVLFKN